MQGLNQGFNAENNPNLTCIEVDDVAFSTVNWTNIDPQTSFSTDCMNSCIVGLEGFNENFENLSFFPNPIKEELSIDLGEITSNVNVMVRNSLGQLISEETIVNNNQFSININGPSGLYFVELLDTEKNRKTIKVLKE